MKTQYTQLENGNIKITNAILGVAIAQKENGEFVAYKVYEKTDKSGFMSAFTTPKDKEILKLLSDGIIQSIVDLKLYSTDKSLVEDLEDIKSGKRAPVHAYQSKITNFVNDKKDPYNLKKCTIETNASNTGDTVIENAKRDKVELYKSRNYQDLHFIKCSNAWRMPVVVWQESDSRVEFFNNDKGVFFLCRYNKETNELISKITLNENEVEQVKKHVDTLFTPYSTVTIEIKKPLAFINSKNNICLNMELVGMLLVLTAPVDLYEKESAVTFITNNDLASACVAPSLTFDGIKDAGLIESKKQTSVYKVIDTLPVAEKETDLSDYVLSAAISEEDEIPF